MKKILMLGTGGTIASRQTKDGLAPGLTPEDILSYIPAVKNVCEVQTKQVCNLDSTNVTPEHWKMMVKAVEDNYAYYDGFVICHGTDTLAYTAAALSYMIQNSAKPIVVTGAQKPINMDVKEHAKSYNAFSSINFPYLAVIQDGILVRYIPEIPCRHAVKFYYDMKDSVYVLKLIPGMKPDILSYLFEHYDCLVIESFGVGGIPQTLVQEFYQEMEKWSGKGKFVVMTTQVANEGSNMTVYEVGKKVKQDFNMIEAYDMTLEAVITKLMWLMGREEQDMQKAFYTQINHDILFTKRG